MEERFADSNYWIALFDPDDFLHIRAIEIAAQLPAFARVITSDFVIIEVLNALSGDTREIKQKAIQLFEHSSLSSSLDVVRWSRELFERAKTLYLRADKSWSIVDCSSFVIMRERGIRDALTYDRHFQQAGFRALLRQDG